MVLRKSKAQTHSMQSKQLRQVHHVRRESRQKCRGFVFLLALISFALALFSPSPVFARDVLRIGVDNVANGYVMRDGHEVLVGSDVDYMQMLAERFSRLSLHSWLYTQPT